MTPVEALFAGLAAAVALTTTVWIGSLVRHDASLIDRFWGLGFVVAADVYALLAPGVLFRALLALTLVTLWGTRLSFHIARRNWGHGEDRRYQEMRARGGAAFPWVSLVTIHWLQAALLWIVALPLWKAVTSPEPESWTSLDLLGAAIALAGLACESSADRQLARFRSDPDNRGKVMDRGLWRYSRHPNYFGDALFWWGLGTIALGTPEAWWTLVGPAVMTFMLMRVSGVALLEKSLVDAKPQYREYIAKTSAFVPWPPRRPSL